MGKLYADEPNFPNPPPGWGDDGLSRQLQLAHEASFATYWRCQPHFRLLAKVQDIFQEVLETLPSKIESDEVHVMLFLYRSNAAFLGAVRLAISGQIPEAYMVNRGCLESALYGYLLAKDFDKFKIWIEREDSENSRKKAVNLLRVKKIIDDMEGHNEGISRVVKSLYERTVTRGAHPNAPTILFPLEINKKQDRIEFKYHYFDHSNPNFELCLQSTAQIGHVSLRIFGLVFERAFIESGISERLDILKGEGSHKQDEPDAS